MIGYCPEALEEALVRDTPTLIPGYDSEVNAGESNGTKEKPQLCNNPVTSVL